MGSEAASPGSGSGAPDGVRLIASRFDTAFRFPDDTERLCFSVPAALCGGCHQLYIDPDLIRILDVADGRCTFAIESDTVLQERAWSSAK